MAERTKIRDRISAEEWETFQRCRFIQTTFRPYPSLAAPLNQEGGTFSVPFRGQPYDCSRYEMIDGGWDHEHCDVCNVRIAEDDTYWTNDGPDHVDLCLKCFSLVHQELRS